jgi:hypothetical protein
VSPLRVGIPALHHFQLLSAAALSKHVAAAHFASRDSGAGAASLQLRDGGLRGYAGTHSSVVGSYDSRTDFFSASGRKEYGSQGAGRVVVSGRQENPLAGGLLVFLE